MLRTIVIVTSGIVACIANGRSAPQCSVVVDPNAQPSSGVFATIGSAQLYLRAARRAAKLSTTSPTVVCIAGGVYHEQLTFADVDSGTASAPVVYAALPGTNVSISGSLPVVFGPMLPDDPAHVYLSAAAAPNVLVANLSAAGLSNVSDLNAWLPRGFSNGGCAASAPLELIYAGVPQTPARWPNANEELDSGPGWALTAHKDGKLTNNSFYADAGACYRQGRPCCLIEPLLARVSVQLRRS
jgi:hypothetical protein